MKKVLSGMLALMLAGTLTAPAFAANEAITVQEVTKTVGAEPEATVAPAELKTTAADEEGMLRISPSTLLKIKLKLEGDETDGKNMSFLANQKLESGDTLSGDKIQFIDEQKIASDGTVSIQFRPRMGSAVGIYNMRANAKNAAMFSRFYKTVADEKMPVLFNAAPTTKGENIEIAMGDYTPKWEEAVELYKITEGQEPEKTAYEIVTIEGASTLKISTESLDVGTHKFCFKPITAGGAYNPLSFTAAVSAALPEYTVSFNETGVGAVKFKGNTIPSGGVTLPTPEKTGYAFEGWYKEAALTNAVASPIKAENLEAVFGSDTSITLYAKWTPVEYKITYNLNEGTNANTNPEKYTIETETITLANPTRFGYTFGGWYRDADCTTRVSEIVKGSTGNKTLYAKWTAKMLEVTKNVVSSSAKEPVVGAVDVIKIDGGVGEKQEGSTVTATVTVPVGYTVQSVKYGNSECEYNEGTKKYSFTMPSEAVEVTVTLEPIVYTINFDLDGGDGTFAAVTGTIEEPPQLPTTEPTKDGHNFNGWVNAATNRPITQAILNNDFAHKIPVFGDSHSITAKALYAARNQYTVIYQAPAVQDITQIPGMQENIDWENNKTVTISATEPSKNGYTFAGWKVKLNNSEEFESDTIYKTGKKDTYTVDEGVTKVTFVAQWTADTYKITYELDGGDNSTENPDKYTAETATITLSSPTKAGYTFGGWFSDDEFHTKETVIAKGSTGDKTLYAKWNEILVTEITVTPSENNTITAEGGIIQFAAAVAPENALDKAIAWSVTDKDGNPTDKITINKTGLLTAKDITSNGEYIVKALNTKSGIAGTTAVTVNITPAEKYKINGYNAENGTVNITKQSTDSAWLIVATYTADGKLVKATIKDISNENTPSKDVSVSNAFDGEYSKAKVFMWESLEKMQPRCPAFPADK